MPDTFRDEQWQSDYHEALEELGVESPRCRALALVRTVEPPRFTRREPRPVLTPFSVRREKVVDGPISRDDFDTDSAYRQAILQRTDIKKTADARYREVFYLGERIGRVARSPYTPMTWISESNRRYPFSSAADAALDLVTARVPELGGTP